MWTLMIGSKAYKVRDYAEASRTYADARDQSGASAAAFPFGQLLDARGADIARISYNARVWSPRPWEPGDIPLYDPAAAEGKR